jgi:hypothetical protein
MIENIEVRWACRLTPAHYLKAWRQMGLYGNHTLQTKHCRNVFFNVNAGYDVN